jgi:hypothetical protein
VRGAGMAGLGILAAAAAVLAQAPSPSPTPSPTASPSASPSPSPSPLRPLTDSVDRAVQRALAEHGQPCLPAQKEGLPCFPVAVEATPAPEESVAEAFRRYKDDRPTAASLSLSPSGTPVVGISFDPFCAAKAVMKVLRGRNDTYYLYRLWNAQGEHAVLRERPIEMGAYGAVPDAVYEFVDRINGACVAVAAWRKANREAVERNDRNKAAR